MHAQNVLYCECLLVNCEDRILGEKVASDSEKKEVFWNECAICYSSVATLIMSFQFQMSAARLLVSVVFFSFLNLHNAAAQSQMCEEPFKAAITITANVTLPISASNLDPDLVFYRNILRFTEEEIDRDREAAMQFYNDMYGLDFTNIEPNDQGQRILGNATFEPGMSPFNLTYVFNSWLVSGRTKTKCFPAANGGFGVRFTGPMLLHGEYGGEEGKLVSTNENLFYGYGYVFDACKQQGLTFQFQSLAPSRSVPVDGYGVAIFRVHNRMLGEGILWGVERMTTINATTLRLEIRDSLTFV